MSKDDHLGVDLNEEREYGLTSLERIYKLILRYMNGANATRNGDGVDMALHLLNAGHTGVSALSLVFHGYAFQASILLRHIAEVSALVHSSRIHESNWLDFQEKRGKANYERLLGVAEKLVPRLRETHSPLSNYSQHVNLCRVRFHSLRKSETRSASRSLATGARASPQSPARLQSRCAQLCAT